MLFISEMQLWDDYFVTYISAPFCSISTLASQSMTVPFFSVAFVALNRSFFPASVSSESSVLSLSCISFCTFPRMTVTSSCADLLLLSVTYKSSQQVCK